MLDRWGCSCRGNGLNGWISEVSQCERLLSNCLESNCHCSRVMGLSDVGDGDINDLTYVVEDDWVSGG